MVHITDQKASQPQTSSMADTNTLVATLLYGKTLRQRSRMSESPQTSVSATQAKMQSKCIQIQSCCKCDCNNVRKLGQKVKCYVSNSSHSFQVI